MGSIVVQEATDADIPNACALEALAYADSPANPILFPGPFPPDARGRRIKQIIEMRENDATAVFLKAVNEGTGEMIAFAKWHFYETEEIAQKAPTRPLRFGEGTNREACETLFGGLVSKKKVIMGSKPHLYLHMLHTDPKQQGCGAGSALLKWGTQKADELGLPVYLESSPGANGFYRRRGFEDVDNVALDLSLYGDEKKVYTVSLMIRQPAKVS